MLRILFAFLAFSPFVSFAQLNFKNDLICDKDDYCQHRKAHKRSLKGAAQKAKIDVVFEELNLNVDPASSFISGRVAIDFILHQPTDSIDFDLAANLIVNSIDHNGNSLAFDHQSNDVVMIANSDSIGVGQLARIVIDYKGYPNQNTGAFTQENYHSMPVVYTLSEPYGAREWWPCRDNLEDRIDSIDINLTVPTSQKAGANGLLHNVVLDTNQTHTFQWKHRFSNPAYLIAISVADFDTASYHISTSYGDVYMQNFLYPYSAEIHFHDLTTADTCFYIFDDILPPYPYQAEKYGHMQFGWSGGMEHTTMSSMGAFNHNVIAHELGHQWFGDWITCGSWSDLWLNEGFATYTEAFYFEHYLDGLFWNQWKNVVKSKATSLDDGSVYVYGADTLNESRLFSSQLTYNKGGFVLHTLRWVLGDEDFFEVLHDYLANPIYADGFATTEDLIDQIAVTTGRDLTEYFNDFVYAEGYPEYRIEWDQVNGQFETSIFQDNSSGDTTFFDLPIPLRLQGNGIDSMVVLDNHIDGEQFSFPVSFDVYSVAFDPDVWLLAQLISLDYVGVEEVNSAEKSYALYPNPTNNYIELTAQKESFRPNSYRIIDLVGKVFLQEQIPHQLSSVFRINVAQLPKGAYFIELRSENAQEALPFIKE